jgi:hypothetical protein
MTFVSVAEATSRLGIDAKTLRGFLADAHLPLQDHPHDGRKKGLSGEHLQVLARLHQRSLAPLPTFATCAHPRRAGAFGCAAGPARDLVRLTGAGRCVAAAGGGALPPASAARARQPGGSDPAGQDGCAST